MHSYQSPPQNCKRYSEIISIFDLANNQTHEKTTITNIIGMFYRRNFSL